MWDVLCQEVIESELSNNEKLLWSGKPRQGIVFRSFDILFIPFSIMWGGFAIFWEIMALSIVHKNNAEPAAFIFPIFGIPFVIAGLYLIFGRFIYDSHQRKKTFYGLTNQRIIVVSGLFSRKVKSLNLKTLDNMSLAEKSDRSGTISFGQQDPFWQRLGGMTYPGMPKPISLEMIEDAREVYEKIREAQELKQ